MEDKTLCPVCNNNLHFKRQKFESDIGSTDVYSVLDGMCTNPNCTSYAGEDLSNPLTVARVVRNLVSE